MGLKTAIGGTVLRTVIEKVAASEPRTTALGATLGGLVASKIDYSKLLQGDPAQVGLAVAAVVVALMGYFTNHPGVTPTPKN